jgi:hypothetical protein
MGEGVDEALGRALVRTALSPSVWADSLCVDDDSQWCMRQVAGTGPSGEWSSRHGKERGGVHQGSAFVVAQATRFTRRARAQRRAPAGIGAGERCQVGQQEREETDGGPPSCTGFVVVGRWVRSCGSGPLSEEKNFRLSINLFHYTQERK